MSIQAIIINGSVLPSGSLLCASERRTFAVPNEWVYSLSVAGSGLYHPCCNENSWRACPSMPYYLIPELMMGVAFPKKAWNTFREHG